MLRRLALVFTNCASRWTVADAAAVRRMLAYIFVLPSCTPAAGAQEHLLAGRMGPHRRPDQQHSGAEATRHVLCKICAASSP